MDRFDAMTVLVTAVDEGSLARAGRKLGRSPAAVSRAVAFLEDRLGTQILHRTTRSIKLSEAGEHYATVCRQVLTELKEAELQAAGEQSSPRGTLSITAPVFSGEEILRPILSQFLERHPNVAARLHLLDRFVNMMDEGIDVAVRIGHLRDSSMVGIRVGEVRRVIAAAPSYLNKHGAIEDLSDLSHHQIIGHPQFGLDSWTFPPLDGSTIPRTVQFTPIFTVNSVRAAVAATIEGNGVTRLLSYQLADHVAEGRLQIVLPSEETEPWPVTLVTPQGRLSIPKVRAFVDFALPLLRARYTQLSMTSA